MQSYAKISGVIYTNILHSPPTGHPSQWVRAMVQSVQGQPAGRAAADGADPAAAGAVSAEGRGPAGRGRERHM